LLWGRNSNRVNAAGAPHITAETATFSSALSKSFASGASFRVGSDWDYLGTNSAGVLFPSQYSGNIGASIRQPLLAGSGVEFTRVAGPVNPAFGAITGVSQGVTIARINQDLTLAEFEIAVRNGISDIENAYWDLYFSYRQYDTAVTSHESAFESWRQARANLDVGTGLQEDELLARDRFYETETQVELALNNLYKAEAELRRLAGLPMNDGQVLRPSESPAIAKFEPDWHACVVEGLTYRTELRRQKWQIKSLQLQLNAARSLVRPRLDAIASYDVNGFGDRLLGENTTDPVTGLPVRNAFGSMTADDLESWTMGMAFSMPLGLREARSQVRNYELQLARATAVLAAQERSIAHDIATAIQDVTAAWTATQSNQNRYEAAAERVEIITFAYENGRRDATLDLVLRAQASAAQAENAYFQQVVAYNKAITALHLATGQLLTVNNIYLAEGRWCEEAYCDAELRAVERTQARDNEHLETAPHEFVSPGPPGTVELVRPKFEDQSADVAPAEAPPVPAADQGSSESTTGEPLAEPAAVPAEPTAAPAEPTAAPAEPTAAPAEPTAVPAEPTAVPAEPREDLPAESSSGRSSARAAGPLAIPPYRLIPASHSSAVVADEAPRPLF
jgi:outer membrane protein TolC